MDIEIKNIIPSKSLEKVKHLGVNLNKYVQGMYSWNQNAGETNQKAISKKIYHVHGLEFNCMSINPKLIYRFKVIPIKM